VKHALPMTKRERVERKRQSIIKAARIVFESRGYDGTTISDVAQRANISVGAVYLYFKNKEELALACAKVQNQGTVYDALKMLAVVQKTA